MTAMLEMRGVSKSFAGVQALRDVNFTVGRRARSMPWWARTAPASRR